MANKKEVCELLDKLTIEVFNLIEQKVIGKLNIENSSVEGQLLMAKSRYIQGTNSVSIAQLPTENTLEFNALAQTVLGKTDILADTLDVTHRKVDKEAGYPDPLQWFGILVPQSLIAAKNKFKSSIEYAVECANIQINLLNTISNIIKLRKIKADF